MSQIEVKHLKMISSIARTGNMTKSAQNLFITQSALSQQLKDIESKLSADLFYRTRKKMILTPIGKKVLKTADKVIEQLEDTELEIAKIVSGESGELKVGTQCIFCYKWLPKVLAVFQEKYPNIEFEIGRSIAFEEELESKQFDLVITAGQQIKDHFKSYMLFEDQMVCIVSNSHPLSALPYVKWEDFGGECLISHSDKQSNRFYKGILKPIGVELRRFMTIEQPQAIIEMVSAGFGISMFPKWALKNVMESSNIKALSITGHGIPVTWSATVLKAQDVMGYQKEFINIVSKMNLTNTPLELRS